MFNTVIFDMDGVIIDSEPIHFKLEKEFFNKLNIKVSHQEHCSYVGTTSKYMWSKIIEKHNLEYSLEELIKIERSNYTNYILSKKDISPIDGVQEFIYELYKNKVNLILASSASRKDIEIIMNKFSLNKYFAITISGDDVLNGKPEPDIFIAATKSINVKNKQCIVIEDSSNGIIAAKKAGMKCIGYKNINSGEQDLTLADLTIQSFKEINYHKLSCYFS